MAACLGGFLVWSVSGCVEKETKPAESETPNVAEGTDADFKGKKTEEAGALAESRGLKWRVTEKDGESLPATMDYREDRVNFGVENGIVVKVSRG